MVYRRTFHLPTSMSIIKLFKPTEDIRGIDTIEIEGMVFKALIMRPLDISRSTYRQMTRLHYSKRNWFE